MPPNGETVLEVRDLRTWFHTRHGVAKSVDGVDIRVNKGEVLCIVGESGCGKSVTALSIMRLIPPPGRIETGRLLFDGEDLLALSADRMADLRGQSISMIFQDPTSSLNPVFEVGLQIAEVYEIHRDMTRKVGEEKAVEMLEKVGIPDPGRRARSYPHEMSGGMAQRVMIAMALACEPRLLIADEPTTALDVTIQAQILDLIGELIAEFDLSVILISHDLGVVATVCDRVAVMYAGQIVEMASVADLFDAPHHPYTKGLLAAVPHPERPAEALASIPGSLPNLLSPPQGCRFRGRCAHEMPSCVARPAVTRLSASHGVACWLHEATADA